MKRRHRHRERCWLGSLFVVLVCLRQRLNSAAQRARRRAQCLSVCAPEQPGQARVRPLFHRVLLVGRKGPGLVVVLFVGRLAQKRNKRKKAKEKRKEREKRKEKIGRVVCGEGTVVVFESSQMHQQKSRYPSKLIPSSRCTVQQPITAVRAATTGKLGGS